MSNAFRAFCLLLVITSLVACAINAGPSSRNAGGNMLTVQGELAYRERIALPPNSQARITIRDTSIADRKAPVIASRRIDLAGRQVPIPFEFEIAKARLEPRRRYSLRATISGPQDALLWTTDTAYPVERDRKVNDFGTLILVRGNVQPPADTPVRTALPFEASGNEPGWQLRIDADRMVLDWAYGQKRIQTPRPEPVSTDDGTRYTVVTEAHDLHVQITDEVCRDSMSGMPHPRRVVVTIDGDRLEGCGGELKSLLTGTEWVVEDIAERGIIDSSRVTLNFGPDGHLSGRSSCNHYQTEYTLTGEGLEVGHIAATLMVCAPALNNQEDRFLDVLGGAHRFDIDPTGKLIIHAASGETIEAYPAG